MPQEAKNKHKSGMHDSATLTRWSNTRVNLTEGQFQKFSVRTGGAWQTPYSEWTHREIALSSAEKASGERNVPGSPHPHPPLCSKELCLLSRQKSTFDKNQNNYERTGVQVSWMQGSEIRFLAGWQSSGGLGSCPFVYQHGQSTPCSAAKLSSPLFPKQ